MPEKQTDGQNKPKVFVKFLMAGILLAAAIAIGAGVPRSTMSFPGKSYYVGCYWDNRYDSYQVSLEGGEFVTENVRTKAIRKSKQVLFAQRDDDFDDSGARRVTVTILPEKERFLLEPEICYDPERMIWHLMKPEEATQFPALFSDGQKSHEVIIDYRELAGR